MATKKAAAKKTTSSSKTRVTKVSASNSKSKLSKLPVSIYKEQNPEKHKLTGKYKALFVFLSVGLGVFAAIAVWEFAYSVKLLEQYQRIEACARIGERCEVTIKEDVNVDETEAEAVDADTETYTEE